MSPANERDLVFGDVYALNVGQLNFCMGFLLNIEEVESIPQDCWPKHKPEINCSRGIVRSNSTSFEAIEKFLPS